jgi:branched-chain amino acid transport system ATP-binding protein
LPLLEVSDVVVRFGGVVAVDGASFAVDEGKVAALIGPNGAGKTTTFNVVTGLQPPTSGEVTFEGKDITKLPVHKRARLGIGRTFQRLEVFGSLTVRENILVSAEIHRRWSDSEDDPKTITDRIIELIGLERFARQPADSVPTGIARLTELGRALAAEPRLLLLDEPSSGLNDTETDELGELLRRLADEEGRAILLVEHDVDLVMSVSDWIDVLDFGKIIASGTPEDIRNDERVQAAYLGADTDGGGQDAADGEGSDNQTQELKPIDAETQEPVS